MKERLIKMCQPSTETLIVPSTNAYSTTTNSNNITTEEDEDKVPIESVVPAPSFAARYACTSVLVGIFAIWSKFTFVPESEFPGGMTEMHSWIVPAGFTVFYLLSLPLLRYLSREYLTVDVKVLLRECMILYNAAQVLLNGWMVYRFLDALLWNGHPFISAPVDLVTSGASYAVWLHYCDKYLEFLDTYFMVLRGKMDQVRKPTLKRQTADRQ
jgi:elongation of very long chain fatty acids protein 4